MSTNKKNKAIAIRIEDWVYEKLLDISLQKSKEEKRNVGVSDVIRNIIKKEIK